MVFRAGGTAGKPLVLILMPIQIQTLRLVHLGHTCIWPLRNPHKRPRTPPATAFVRVLSPRRTRRHGRTALSRLRLREVGSRTARLLNTGPRCAEIRIPDGVNGADTIEGPRRQ